MQDRTKTVSGSKTGTKNRVVGPRVLIRVKKYNAKKDETFEGFSILMPEDMTEKETTTQTQGEVISIGECAFSGHPFKLREKDGHCWANIGDIVKFSQYGAQRLDTKDNEDYEFWVINDKDILAVVETQVDGE